jgi:tetratricopeptide (TPR) repeat protein
MTDAETVTEIVDRAEQALARSDESTAAAALHTLDERGDEQAPALAGRILALRGRLHRATAEADYRSAAEHFAAAGEETRRQLVLGRLGALLCEFQRSAEGLRLLRTAVRYFQGTGDADSEVWTSLRLVSSLVALSDREEAAQILDHADELAAGLTDELMPGALAWARADLCGDDVDANIETTTAALRAFTETGVPRMIAAAHFRLSGLWRAKGEPQRGLTEVEQAVATMDATSPASLRATVLTSHGDVLVQLGRGEEAAPVLLDAVGCATESGDHLLIGNAHRSLAVAYRGSSLLEEAADAALAAIAAFETVDDLKAANLARYLLAEIRIGMAQPEAALVVYDEIVAASRAHGTLEGVPQVMVESADLLDYLNHDAKAAQRYRDAGDVAATTGDLYLVAYCRYQEALSLVWCERPAEALPVLSEAERAVGNLPDDDPTTKKRHAAQLAQNAVRVQRANRHFNAAVFNADRAINMLAEADQPDKVPGAQLVLGQLLIEVDRLQDAEIYLRAALENANNQGEPSPRIASTLAMALDLQGRKAEAAHFRQLADVSQN